MKSRRRVIVLAIFGLLVLTGLLAAGAVATTFAYRQLSRNEDVELSFLPGRSAVQETTEELPLSDQGVLVQRVDPQSPAAEAGLRRGAIILQVDAVAVNSPQELQREIRQHEAGDVITLTVLKCDSPEEIEVTLASAGPYLGVDIGGGRSDRLPMPGQLPPGFPESLFPPGREFDFQFPELPEELSRAAVVVNVVPSSPAEEAGLQHGDLIVAVNGVSVERREQVVEQIRQLAPGDVVELNVRRGDQELDITASLAEHPDLEGRAFLGVELAQFSLSRESFRAPSQSS